MNSVDLVFHLLVIGIIYLNLIGTRQSPKISNFSLLFHVKRPDLDIQFENQIRSYLKECNIRSSQKFDFCLMSSRQFIEEIGRGQSFITGLPYERLQTCVVIYFPNLIEEFFRL